MPTPLIVNAVSSAAPGSGNERAVEQKAQTQLIDGIGSSAAEITVQFRLHEASNQIDLRAAHSAQVVCRLMQNWTICFLV